MALRPINSLIKNFDGHVFILLSLLSAGLNYLYYPLIANLLSVEEFGSSQALITLLTQVGSLFAGLSILSIYYIKKFGFQRATKIIAQTQKIIIFSLILVTLIVGAFHTQIAQFLNMEDNLDILLVSADLILSIPFIVLFGTLLAQKRFISASVMQVIVASSKLILGFILVPSFSTTGAIVAIGLSYVIGIFIFWVSAKVLKKETWPHGIMRSYIPPSISELLSYRPYYVTTLCILVASTCLVVLPGVDVLLARHHLEPTDAGIYAAASTLSSIVLFASMPIVNLLVPSIDTKHLRQSLSRMLKHIFGMVIIYGVSLFSMVVLPGVLLSLFGQSYTSIAGVLWIFGVNMFLISVLTFTFQIITLYRPSIAAVFGLMTVMLSIVLITINSTAKENIILASVTAYAIMSVIAGLVVMVYALKKARYNA